MKANTTEQLERTIMTYQQECKNLRARLQTAEQQLGQVTKELESVQQDLYETNESYEKAAHDRDVGVKDCRRLVTELGQVREEVNELRAVFAHSDDALLSAYNEGYATAQGSSGDANMERKYLDHWKQCRDKALSTPSDGCGKGRMDGDQYLILSLSHSPADGNALWWGPNNSGYAQCVENAGRYTLEQVTKEKSYYDNGDSTKAFPLSEALRLGRSGTKVDWLDAKQVASKLTPLHMTNHEHSN